MISPIRSAGYTNVQTNAGAILAGIDPGDKTTYASVSAFKTAVASALSDATKCIGMTRGGGGFHVTKETREIEADGKRYRFVGSTQVDSQDAYLNTTILEITPENLIRALATADDDSAETRTDITHIKPRTQYATTDYIDCITWVGDTNYGMMAIVLYNAINTSNLDFTITDKGEGTLNVEFHATQETVTGDTPPFGIYLLED